MKKVLITAGASGIGLAMAQAFAADKHDIWVTDISETALEACPTNWHRIHADATDEAEVARIITKMGSIDTLCANAGIAGPTARVEDVELNDWRTCVSVNLEGAFLAAKHAVPLMKQAGSGSICLTSSTAGIYGFPNRAPYASAKWAMIGLMKTLAMELGPFGIRANVICPGSVEGPRIEAVLEREAKAKGVTRDQVYQGYASGTSMRTFVEARDIADMAVFLASDRARFVSGQVVAVDGHTENPDPKFEHNSSPLKQDRTD